MTYLISDQYPQLDRDAIFLLLSGWNNISRVNWSTIHIGRHKQVLLFYQISQDLILSHKNQDQLASLYLASTSKSSTLQQANYANLWKQVQSILLSHCLHLSCRLSSTTTTNLSKNISALYLDIIILVILVITMKTDTSM